MAKRRGNNEGSIYKRADGRWAAGVTLPAGKRRTLYDKRATGRPGGDDYREHGRAGDRARRGAREAEAPEARAEGEVDRWSSVTIFGWPHFSGRCLPSARCACC